MSFCFLINLPNNQYTVLRNLFPFCCHQQVVAKAAISQWCELLLWCSIGYDKVTRELLDLLHTPHLMLQQGKTHHMKVLIQVTNLWY